MGGLTIRLSGPFAVLDPSGRPIAISSRKSRRLLARLSAWPGRTVGLDEIQADLWPQQPPRRPVDNIATMVSRLRSALGAEVVLRDAAGYRLGGPPAVGIDVQDAIALDAEARRRVDAGEPGLAAAAARRGLDLVADQEVLLGEDAADWVDTFRAEVAALRRQLRCHLAEAALAVGDPRTAAAAAGAVAADDALDEHAHRLLMAAHHAAGEPARAVASYERLRAALADELGIDPAAETQALHVAVLRGGRAAAPARPGSAVRRNRVAPAGRDDELARLTTTWSAVGSGAPALVLLTGEAGIGNP